MKLTKEEFERIVYIKNLKVEDFEYRLCDVVDGSSFVDPKVLKELEGMSEEDLLELKNKAASIPRAKLDLIVSLLQDRIAKLRKELTSIYTEFGHTKEEIDVILNKISPTVDTNSLIS